jgi:hypothetical protein
MKIALQIFCPTAEFLAALSVGTALASAVTTLGQSARPSSKSTLQAAQTPALLHG